MPTFTYQKKTVPSYILIPIDVHFIGRPDPHISPIGAHGIGEIGITGVSAAIANAVCNATGKDCGIYH